MKKILFLMFAVVMFTATSFAQTESDVIVLKEKNGKETKLLTDGLTYTFEKVKGFGIDVDATVKYGGASYDRNKNEIVSFFYDKGIKIFLVSENRWVKYTWDNIKTDWKNLSGGKGFRISYYSSYPAVVWINGEDVEFSCIVKNNPSGGSGSAAIWNFNGNSPFANDTKNSANTGSMTIEYINYENVKRTVVATFWD